MPNAITMLKADHVKVKQLLKKLEATTSRGGATRERLLAQIEKEVTVHSTLEEEFLYPAFHEAARKKDDTEMFFEATEEHHVVDLVMPEIKEADASSEEFGAKAKVLKELIEHHIREEESEMFPRAKVLLNEDELAALGERMQERKQELSNEWEASEPKRSRSQSSPARRASARTESRIRR